MNTRALPNRKLGALVLVRPLRDGDVETVAAVFDRLSPESRARRFHGAKPRLSDSECACLARVDADRHVLVAHVDGDETAAAMARLVRCREDHRAAEIAFEVADRYQQRGIGSALTAELIADARAAGISQITALVASDNPAALALLRRVLKVLDIRHEGLELSIRAALA
jgi:ribosomal protein S18 acetylase RimI-like enzyme